MLKISVTVLFLLGLHTAPFPSPTPDAPDSIEAREILATARFLASDALAGRGAGTPEGRIAGLYIASRFEALGLEPLGEGKGFFQPLEKGQNVLALLPGGDPERSGETIVLGAHCDHLGQSDEGIFNGADDNASGIAVLLAVAEALVRGPRPGRSVVFAAFDAEERGLVGSSAYCKDPPIPLEKTVLMVNIDMVGRDFADLFPLFLFAVGTEYSPSVRKALDGENEKGPGFRLLRFSASLLEELWASSDHKPFWKAEVPILFLTTGMHADYHLVSDDTDRLKPEKMAKVATLVTGIIRSVAGSDGRPVFQQQDELITADDRDCVLAIIRPAIQMGPMMGIQPEVLGRLKEVQAIVEDADHEWTKAEIGQLCSELRSLMKNIRRP